MTPERRQALFTRVAVHLIKQGRPAFDGETCRYRYVDLDGVELKCAVGCLIPDEAYTSDIEGYSIRGFSYSKTVTLQTALTKSGIDVEDLEEVEFLKELQQIHDSCGSPSYWAAVIPKWLTEIAQKYNLEMPSVGERND